MSLPTKAGWSVGLCRSAVCRALIAEGGVWSFEYPLTNIQCRVYGLLSIRCFPVHTYFELENSFQGRKWDWASGVFCVCNGVCVCVVCNTVNCITVQVHPKTKTAEQDELSSLLQVPIVVCVDALVTTLYSCIGSS